MHGQLAGADEADVAAGRQIRAEGAWPADHGGEPGYLTSTVGPLRHRNASAIRDERCDQWMGVRDTMAESDERPKRHHRPHGRRRRVHLAHYEVSLARVVLDDQAELARLDDGVGSVGKWLLRLHHLLRMKGKRIRIGHRRELVERCRITNREPDEEVTA